MDAERLEGDNEMKTPAEQIRKIARDVGEQAQFHYTWDSTVDGYLKVTAGKLQALADHLESEPSGGLREEQIRAINGASDERHRLRVGAEERVVSILVDHFKKTTVRTAADAGTPWSAYMEDAFLRSAKKFAPVVVAAIFDEEA